MKLSLTRKGAKANSPLSPRYEYTVGLGAFPKDQYGEGRIEFGFETNAGGLRRSYLFGSIHLKQFEELARLMIKAGSASSNQGIRSGPAGCQNPERVRRGIRIRSRISAEAGAYLRTGASSPDERYPGLPRQAQCRFCLSLRSYGLQGLASPFAIARRVG